MTIVRLAFFGSMVLSIGCAATGDEPRGSDGDGTTGAGGSEVGGAGPGTGGVGSSSGTGGTSMQTGSGGGAPSICEQGQTQSCWPFDPALEGIGACEAGQQTCVMTDDGEFVTGDWGPCEGAVGPSGEVCGNALDDDCDGTADEDCEGPDDPCAVGRALLVGCGRAFIWGDEHVSMDSCWPDPAPYWQNAFDWLLDPGACNVSRTKVWLGANLPPQVEADLQAAGLVITSSWGIPTAADLASHDVVILNIFGQGPTPADGAALQAWVDQGGALMTMIVGIGSGQDECLDANPAIEPLGVAYSCFEPVPWGPVATFGVHPIAANLQSVNTPFVNGRFVVETNPAVASTVVASVAGVCPP
jgi:hypothetical protein